MRETLIEVGFVYYFILARFYDIDPRMQEKEGAAASPFSPSNSAKIFTEVFPLKLSTR